jgi:hypothetical protein
MRAADHTKVVVGDIAAERHRQRRVEGYHPLHDDTHCDGELARAAAAYITGDITLWPWDRTYWKPKTRRSDLVRAAALLVAEIERLDRKGED